MHSYLLSGQIQWPFFVLVSHVLSAVFNVINHFTEILIFLSFVPLNSSACLHFTVDFLHSLLVEGRQPFPSLQLFLFLCSPGNIGIPSGIGNGRAKMSESSLISPFLSTSLNPSLSTLSAQRYI